ncbi:MAG: histidine--tRNA ligase [Candidatus Diapherotrites archaeon]|nr:histidine--tRNA ligase [Candidatus Diapherotrites archaeon]
MAEEKFQAIRGMRDILPEQARKKLFLEGLARRIFEKYGFQPMQTPVVEDFALLAKKGSGGEAIKEEIYYFKDKSERELGLRFDLTVPLARVIATNPQLPKPFKRYQIERVYRYDRPGAKRYREFTQADADIIGVKSVFADFELIALAAEFFSEINVDFYIRLNNRKLLEAVAQANGVEERQIKDCFRSLDKLEKIGEEEVRKELEQKGISDKIIETLKKNDFEGLPKDVKEKDGFKELKELLDLLEENGLSKKVKVDLSLARGLEYYTGNVFEVSSAGISCGGGGRYDNLIESYGGSPTPAIGISFGIDRLLDVVEEKLGVENPVKFFVIPIGKTQKECLKIVQEMRRLGLNTDIDLVGRGISKNLEFASKQGIKFAIIAGEDELQKKELAVKNLETGEQKTVRLDALKELWDLE